MSDEFQRIEDMIEKFEAVINGLVKRIEDLEKANNQAPTHPPTQLSTPMPVYAQAKSVGFRWPHMLPPRPEPQLSRRENL